MEPNEIDEYIKDNKINLGIKQKEKLIFVVPDEDTEYFFEINHANFEEME